MCPYYYEIFSNEHVKCKILHDINSYDNTKKIESMVVKDSSNFFNYVNTISKTKNYSSVMH